ncbi:MAG: DUF1367 family protein [Candidatus Thiodiazotropha weberae]|nr:DUF1367 family protein [Candidatus Thiodiazotropha weberae]
MTEVYFQKLGNGTFVPASENDAATVAHIKIGEWIKCVFTRPRNIKFFRKWWTLVDYAFEHWQSLELEEPKWKGVVPEKNKDRFRKDLTILAGHYESFYRVDGSVRVEAKSISFASMSEEEFEGFYSACIDVVLKHILKNYKRDDLEQVVEQLLMGYA